MKKGLAEEFGWPPILLLIAVVVLVVGLILSIIIRLPGIGSGPISPSLEYVVLRNKPYLVSEVLSNYMVDDRQVLEHALESSFTGSLENSGSTNIEKDIKLFMNNYIEDQSLRYYSVVIRDTEGKEIFYADSMFHKCGQNQEGICVKDVRYCITSIPISGNPLDPYRCIQYSKAYHGCGRARDEISDVNDNCKHDEACCVDYELRDDENYHSKLTGNVLTPECGLPDNKRGVCDVGTPATYVRVLIPGSLIPIYQNIAVLGCREGWKRIEEEANECDENRGVTCCVPISTYAEEPTAEALAATPLLYKSDKLGWFEVIVGA
jgi:hypothetical protein